MSLFAGRPLTNYPVGRWDYDCFEISSDLAAAAVPMTPAHLKMTKRAPLETSATSTTKSD
jgi:hypothetical protein